MAPSVVGASDRWPVAGVASDRGDRVADDALARGRAAFQERTWQECWSSLSEADDQSPLGADDLVLLSLAAYLSGHDQDSVDTLSRAYRGTSTPAGCPTPPGRRSGWRSCCSTPVS